MSSMSKAERVLSLLEALQDHPSLTGPELARRLGIDVRSLRRDVTSLRDLGIPVDAERGPAGGYRLRPGYRMPPLMLTETEATAVALGLVAARRDGLDADGALAKIQRVLPDKVIAWHYGRGDYARMQRKESLRVRLPKAEQP